MNTTTLVNTAKIGSVHKKEKNVQAPQFKNYHTHTMLRCKIYTMELILNGTTRMEI